MVNNAIGPGNCSELLPIVMASADSSGICLSLGATQTWDRRLTIVSHFAPKREGLFPLQSSLRILSKIDQRMIKVRYCHHSSVFNLCRIFGNIPTNSCSPYFDWFLRLSAPCFQASAVAEQLCSAEFPGHIVGIVQNLVHECMHQYLGIWGSSIWGFVTCKNQHGWV